MFSTVLSASLRGLFVEFVHVEADTSNGLPMFHMVGYLSSEVKEAGERVRTAIKNSGIVLPAKKVVINLSPANIRKRGTMFDLPIAIAILASLGEVEEERLHDLLIVGELSLDGRVKQVPGVLPVVMEAKNRGIKTCIVPKENQREGTLADGITVIGVETLEEVCRILRGETIRRQEIREDMRESVIPCEPSALDYSDIHGQRIAKRAAEIAAAGNHNLLMMGPPGSGKSMIAKRIPTILPPLTKEEGIELSKLYSVAGSLNQEAPLMKERPFREVHQSVTRAALIGGGVFPKPGELSLAHKGVLFLDEIAEFQKPVLELLRQPLEERQIKIIREQGEYVFPADVLLVAAMNPCPCGHYPDLNKCVCTSVQIRNYLGRLSQPFLDRIDLCVEVEKIRYQDLKEARREESSEEIRKRVCAARSVQRKRYQNCRVSTNGELCVKEVEQYCRLGLEEEKMMRRAFEQMNLTARMYYKVLAVARTIADLEGEEKITAVHLGEALSYRSMDQKYWGGGAA